MQDTPANRILLGGAFFVVGLFLIIFHRRIRKWQDALSKYDPLARWGDWWTGEYTRGGLILSYGITILLGLFFLVEGLLIIFRVVD
jgi:hypothetical protein